jgi:hypothetical protein
MCVHPHSPQPFPPLQLLEEPPSAPSSSAAAAASDAPPPPFEAYLGASRDGTRALCETVARAAPTDLAVGLRELARLPTYASLAFEVANGRALGTFREETIGSYRAFVGPAQDPLAQLGAKDGSILESRATLVVAPSSLLGQWHREVQKWAPHLAVYVFQAPSTYRDWWYCHHAGAWRNMSVQAARTAAAAAAAVASGRGRVARVPPVT